MSFIAQSQSAGIAGILILVTTLALFSQSITTTRVIQLNEAEVTAIDDRSEGGRSEAKLEHTDNSYKLSCTIRASSVTWPYCSLSFNFYNGQHGIDLSRYHEFRLWVRYAEPRSEGIRFQARNFNPDYADLEDDLSLKYNTVEVYRQHSDYPIDIPLQSFQVPSWWLVMRNLSHQYGMPEFSDVHSIDVVTGYVMPPGEYTLIIDKIALRGNWISNDQLYLMLLMIWGGLGFLFWLSNWRWVEQFRSRPNIPSRKQQLGALQNIIEVKNLELQQPPQLLDDSARLNPEEISHYLLARAEKKQALCLMLIEPDTAGLTNASAAHETLSKLGNALHEQIRQTDILARWGQNAFILICPSTDLAFGSQLAEKLRTKIEAQDNGEKLSISIGIAQIRDIDIAQIVKDAEKALRVAKTSGNCVIAATPSTATIAAIP